MLHIRLKCLIIFLLGFFTLSAQAVDRADRLIEFQYQVHVPALKAEDLPLVIMVPLAPSNEQQSVLARSIESSPRQTITGSEVRKEPTYGNEFWAWTINSPRSEPTTVTFRYKVLRHFHSAGPWQAATKHDYKPGEKAPYQRFLEADTRVPIEGELISKLRKEIPKTAITPVQKARAIYDYVVDNMEYKKVGTGWGNGDTYWACSQKYGNCTDFHALLTSMARAEGIPAKFAIGFSIPTDKPQGDIPGYHCWLELYLPQLAWMPVDASEAKKHPEQRELLFGNHPADRIEFSIGRDLKLPGMQAEPLNYFIYPHVEKRGKAVQDLVKTRFTYRILKKEGGKA
ncbi:transglutaminase-like domain-containing protein [Oligoflexus tunisiensis]|uniref:transglutaminase-like domain-containing protein n=1 Tax=Oligoflexus tunisiensis TaxID=708132 RepID=UPI00159F0045|nr:transglutaminase domain-containing protein [Oligoflexus tunisiensis]